MEGCFVTSRQDELFERFLAEGTVNRLFAGHPDLAVEERCRDMGVAARNCSETAGNRS